MKSSLLLAAALLLSAAAHADGCPKPVPHKPHARPVPIPQASCLISLPALPPVAPDEPLDYLPMPPNWWHYPVPADNPPPAVPICTWGGGPIGGGSIITRTIAPHGGGFTRAPEIDPNSATAGLTLLFGALAVVLRRQR